MPPPVRTNRVALSTGTAVVSQSTPTGTVVKRGKVFQGVPQCMEGLHRWDGYHVKIQIVQEGVWFAHATGRGFVREYKKTPL